MTDLHSHVEDPLLADLRSAVGGPDAGVFQAVFGRSAILAARLDSKLRVTEVSDAMVRELGRPKPELCGTGVSELLHPSMRAHVVQKLERLLDGQRNQVVEWVLALRHGVAFGGELTGLAVRDLVGRVDGLLILLRPERDDDHEVVVLDEGALLTPMHARILEGVAAGASTIQLSTQLFLSCGGVEYHLTALLRSMGVRNRSALVAKAYAMGLYCVGSWPPRVLPEYVDDREGQD